MDFPDPGLPGELIIISLTGSRAYGTHRPDSDWDFKGVYVAPGPDWGLLEYPEERFRWENPDVTVHELRKFARMAISSNPNALEILWSPHARTTVSGRILQDGRRCFLSRKAAESYGLYADDQVRKFYAGTGGSRGQGHFRRVKFVIHTYRLMDAGTRLLETGDLDLAVKDPEAEYERAYAVLDEPERMQRDFDGMRGRLFAARDRSPLPEEPDYGEIDDLLRRIRSLH